LKEKGCSQANTIPYVKGHNEKPQGFPNGARRGGKSSLQKKSDTGRKKGQGKGGFFDALACMPEEGSSAARKNPATRYRNVRIGDRCLKLEKRGGARKRKQILKKTLAGDPKSTSNA